MKTISSRHDVLIYAIGYETRASYAAKECPANSVIAISLPPVQGFSYEANTEFAKEAKHTILSDEQITEIELKCEIDQKLSGPVYKDRKISIALDVSSMPRGYMALAIRSIQALSGVYDFNLVILYSTGVYKEPLAQSGAYVEFKPVVGLEGWTVFPERPLTVILGLGYEQDQAVGVVEHFDPSAAWAFVPNGEDSRFLQDVHNSNESLKDILDKERMVEYYVSQPALLYSELRALADMLCKRSRVIMVPAGPKLFSAISILICLELGDEVSLWSASGHAANIPSDTLPAGRILSFEYKFKKNNIEASA